MRSSQRRAPPHYTTSERERKAMFQLVIIGICALALLVGGMVWGLNKLAKKMTAKIPSTHVESQMNQGEESAHSFLRRAPRATGGGSSATTGPIAEDPDSACRQRLEFIRQLSMRYQRLHGSPPPSLAAMGISPEEAVCPRSKESYVYSPATGQVACPYSHHLTY